MAQSPGDLLVRERVADELPGEAGRRALASVGLEWAAEADPRDLSGGERQRLALAMVMAGRAEDGRLPGLVCLDEPTRGMDRARKEDLAEWAGGLADAAPAVVIATHDVEFAALFAERVVLLGDGELIADGPVAEILSGGWYFATEVARILGVAGAISPGAGRTASARAPRLERRGRAMTLAAGGVLRCSPWCWPEGSPGMSAPARRRGWWRWSRRWRRSPSPAGSSSRRSPTSWRPRTSC